MGEGRDLDVIKIKLQNLLNEDNITIHLALFEKIESELKFHKRKIKYELKKIINHKDVVKLSKINKEV